MKPGVPDTVPRTPVAGKEVSGGLRAGEDGVGEGGGGWGWGAWGGVRTLIVTFEDEGGGGEDVEDDEQCLSGQPPPYVETHCG